MTLCPTGTGPMNVTNKHFIHTGLTKGPKILSIYLSIYLTLRDDTFWDFITSQIMVNHGVNQGVEINRLNRSHLGILDLKNTRFQQDIQIPSWVSHISSLLSYICFLGFFLWFFL